LIVGITLERTKLSALPGRYRLGKVGVGEEAVNSKLHYSKTGDGTFGLLIWRVIQRNTETVT